MLAVLCYVCGYGIVCPSLVYVGLSLFIIGGRYVYMVVCVVYAYNLTEYQDQELIGLWVEIPVGYLTKEELNEVVEHLPEREPLNFEDINNTILQLKEYPYEIKQWMILTALGIMAVILIVTVVVIIGKVYHMRGTLGQMGEIFTILKDKPNLSGLLEAGKNCTGEAGKPNISRNQW